MDNIYTVYVHVNLINDKHYVGQTMQPFWERWKSGYGYRNGKQPYFERAIVKYGWDNFDHIILKEGLTHEQANFWEKYYINLWDCTNPKRGYNIKEGRSNGRLSEETRWKISKSRTRKKYGKRGPLREETKEKISEAHKRKSYMSELAKKKLSEKWSGSNNPNYNNHSPLSKERKEKLRQSDPRRKNVVCVETGKIYISSRHAEEQTGICHSGIVRSCNNTKKTAGGFHWKYLEE